MYTTMRSLAADIASVSGFAGTVRLYISSREHESIYAVSDQGLAQRPWSDEILYIVDWVVLQNYLAQELPQNVLCVNAASLDRPEAAAGRNIIVTDAAVTAEQLSPLLSQAAAGQGTDFAPQLLHALYSGSLDQLCHTTSVLCGNPVVFLSFNYRTTASSLLGSENPDIVRICDDGIIGPEFVTFLHDRRNQSLVNSGAPLTMPGAGTRFLYMPITQAGVHLASILLFEDRVAISEEDRQLLSHVARCFRLLHPMLDSAAPTRLIFEYALVRALSDTHVGSPSTRFSSLGYHLKRCLYVIVLDSAAQVSADDLRAHLNSLVSHARQIVGGNGLCTPFNDNVLVLLNLDSPAQLTRILSDFRLFCARNGLRAGLSPCFSDIADLRRHYRYALDAIGLGSLLKLDTDLYVFEDLRIYKFVTTCARSFPPTDLIPDYLTRLIQYDHENNSSLLETLYYYVYTVKNTKAAADMMHIHRNTLLYRLEKVRSIIEVDLDNGDIFLHLMLAFKFLEYDALQNGRDLCFTPIQPKPEVIDPE